MDEQPSASALVATAFDQGVLRLTLTRPEKRYALSDALIAAIGEAFALWATREDAAFAAAWVHDDHWDAVRRMASREKP